jgi:hypothetical protein
LKNNKYSNLQEALNDIQLIWDNCKLYNIEGSDIYKMAVHCEKLVKKTIEKLFKNSIITNKSDKKSKSETKSQDNDDNESENENNENNYLNLQEKMNLTDKIRKLANDGLAAVKYIIYY